MTEHVVTVAGYEWVLGPRWRWDCRCGRGSHGYTNEEAAREHAEEHPTHAARMASLFER